VQTTTDHPIIVGFFFSSSPTDKRPISDVERNASEMLYHTILVKGGVGGATERRVEVILTRYDMYLYKSACQFASINNLIGISGCTNFVVVHKRDIRGT
jgi:hypothetical protein